MSEKSAAVKRRIAILLHEKDRYPKAGSHFIWSLCDVWRKEGIEIIALKGISKYVEADLLIPHVDTTILPDEHLDFFQKYPRVVNRHLRDISKRLISRHLVTLTDDYNGPVIVKSNLNSGGLHDAIFHGSKISFRTRPKKSFLEVLLNRQPKSSRPNWAAINCLDPRDYQVFPSKSAVPEGVFTNESLVVERFLPEYKDGVYYIRICKFFGGRAYCARLGSHHPIVKQENILSREEVPIPDEVADFRRELGMDYGKLDFAIQDGRVCIFDANRTPGPIKSVEQTKANALRLAPGISSFFSSEYGHRPPPDSTGQNHKPERLSKPA